jgi:hypothetical protein
MLKYAADMGIDFADFAGIEQFATAAPFSE